MYSSAAKRFFWVLPHPQKKNKKEDKSLTIVALFILELYVPTCQQAQHVTITCQFNNNTNMNKWWKDYDKQLWKLIQVL